MHVAAFNYDISVHFSVSSKRLCQVADFVLDSAFLSQISYVANFLFYAFILDQAILQNSREIFASKFAITRTQIKKTKEDHLPKMLLILE